VVTVVVILLNVSNVVAGTVVAGTVVAVTIVVVTG